ncbi:ABC-F family ATP-binding cassette domain-containing protein [Lutibaculum baratangense]|nr:ABC-F family ATP-binding cassette domain-containing protein [Lutibaculum baratangense]
MLQISDLVYRLAGRTLFDGASLILPEGSRAGLVGPNGTGKTTLFRLIRGEIPPESGDISLPAGMRLGSVAQEAPEGPQSLLSFVLSADTERTRLMAEAEETKDGARIGEIHARLADIDAYGAEARAARILSGLGFDSAAQARSLSEFSGGWRMRVALAAILFSEPDLLLLDEPTNYLDLEGVMWLESYLARYPRTFLVISHDRDLLNRSVDLIVHLDQGRLTTYAGNYDQFERQRREKLLLQEKHRKKQEAQRAHLQSFVDRFRAKATKARQAQARVKMLQKMEPIPAVVEGTVKPFHLPAPEKPLASPLVAMDGVAVGYGGRPILSRVSLRIDADDRIGLLGANGNGKSTLAKLLSGRLEAMEGQIRRPERMRVGFFAQHQLDELDPSLTPVEQVRRLMPGEDEAKVRARTNQLGFGAEKADVPASKLSGGEKARLLIGLAAFGRPHLLILDEPTNHLDVDSREALIEALNEYEGAVIVISHERHILEAVTDRLWLVAEGRVNPFDGDIDDYRRLILASQRTERTSEEQPGTTGASNKAEQRRAAAARREETAPLRKRVTKLEKEIAEIERKLKTLDEAMADPDLYARDPDRAARLAQEHGRASKLLGEREEEWLAASAELEEAMAAG